MNEQASVVPKTIFLDPKAILARVGLKQGQYVADLGCGGGYFVLEAAREIGDDGVAYGVDILPAALSAVSSRARLYGLFNIRTVWSNVEVFGGARTIKNASIDVVLMTQLLSSSKKYNDILKEAARIAKPDGTLVVIDWRPDHRYRFGPNVKSCLPPEKIKEVVAAHDWQCAEMFSAGPYHFGLIFKQ